MYRYCKTDSSYHILSWTSKGFSNESIKPPSTPNNFLTPSLNYLGTKISVKFSGSCLKQDKVTYTHRNNTIISDPTLKNFYLVQLH